MTNTVKYSLKKRREQLITHLELMLHSEQGMQRITTAKLAEKLCVSEAALYRYFPSKNKMFEALLTHIESNLFARINNITANETDTLNRIYMILKNVLDFARKKPGFTRVLTGHALMFEDPALKKRAADFFIAFELKLINILQMRKLREKTDFRYDVKLIAIHLVAFCEGQFMHYVRTNFKFDNNYNFEKQWFLLKELLD